MKLATVRGDNGPRVGRVDGDRIALLAGTSDVGRLLVDEGSWRERVAEADGTVIAFEDADLAPVVIDPPKIICLGLNYRSHILEMGRELPQYPTLFPKYSRSLIGPRDNIMLPSVSDQVDWEAELAFVIGESVRDVTVDGARRAIAGYTVLNDVSMRDWQWRTTEWLQGKTFERSTPVGPYLVTPDEVGDADDLLLKCLVDGEVMQEGRTSDLLFKPAEVVSYISQFITLEPGDLISTGTPGGVGAARDPQLFLKPGQVVTTSIEGLGDLVNTCVG
ncbi:MAG: 2-hydroxyhepta-2,4-diene-1,7-dioate isomerase [Actinobacteria bacterium]|nr:2-hydroxyhepta-2,4-diene-1,7-dioate isomerase [Actinomycetota bacterium]